MKDYISLYTKLIKKGIRGGPHRVAVYCVFSDTLLGGIIWLIKFDIDWLKGHWNCVHTKQAMAANAKAWLPNTLED